MDSDEYFWMKKYHSSERRKNRKNKNSGLNKFHFCPAFTFKAYKYDITTIEQ